MKVTCRPEEICFSGDAVVSGSTSREDAFLFVRTLDGAYVAECPLNESRFNIINRDSICEVTALNGEMLVRAIKDFEKLVGEVI